jgi:hypothetical protein
MFGVGVGVRVGGFTPVSSGGGFDPDAQAFFDRVTTAGGTLSETEKDATNQLVLDMKSAGIWSSMKAIYPMVGASVNLLSYSNTFSDSAWTKLGTTILSTNNLDPNGGYTASRLDMPNGGGSSQLYNEIITEASAYTASIWVRLVSGSGEFRFGFFDNTTFLTDAITVTSTWQRFSVAKTTASSPSTRGCWLYSNEPNQVIEVYGGQVELGSTATTYAPVAGNRTAEAAAACAQNLKSSSFTGTFSSGWTFASTGVTPNGTSAYMNSGLNASTNLSPTSLSFGGYTSSTANSFGYHGISFPTYLMQTFKSYNFTEFYRTTGTPIAVSNGIVGMVQANQVGSDSRIYTNGTLGAFDVTTMTSLQNKNFYIGATNDVVSANFFDNHLISYYYYADGLTPTQALNHYTAVQAFQTTLSRNV